MPKKKAIDPQAADVRLHVWIPSALVDAARAVMPKTTLADLIRRGLAREVGRPDLAPTRRRGRPPLEKPTAAGK